MNEILHVFQTGWYCFARTCCPSRELHLLITANAVARKRLDSVIAQDLQELVLKVYLEVAKLSGSFLQSAQVPTERVSSVDIRAESGHKQTGTDDVDKDADLILPQVFAYEERKQEEETAWFDQIAAELSALTGPSKQHASRYSLRRGAVIAGSVLEVVHNK
eukprot:4741049-Amphidinium_carterae.1